MKETERLYVDKEQFASPEAAIAAVRYNGEYEAFLTEFSPLLESRIPNASRVGLFFLSAVSRSRALHEAAAREIEASNPHATIALLRQFAEMVALTFYVADHHSEADLLWDGAHKASGNGAKPASIGRTMSHMDKRYSEQMCLVYRELSGGTHFGVAAFIEGFRAKDGESVVWSSTPQWRSDDDLLRSCAWLLELSDGMRKALERLMTTCKEAFPIAFAG